MTETDGKLRARLVLPCRRTPALICCRQSATCPAWSLRHPPLPGVRPVPAFLLLLARAIAGAPVCGTSADAWNSAVRTRGVFTHRDDFQKPACVERGLVRTGKTLGRPGLVRTGITPVIPESAGPSALCYFEATGPADAILRPSARPVYALFLEPAPPMRCS